MAKAGDCSVVSSKEIFEMRYLSVRADEGGEGFRGIVDGERIKRSVVEGTSGGHDG